MWEVWYFRVKFSQWIVERTWELEMKKRTVLRKRGNVYYILELLQWSDLGFVSIPGQIFLIMVFLIHLVSLIPFFLVALNLQSCKLPLKYVTYKTIKWFISLARFHHLEVYTFFRPFESFLWMVDKTLIIRMLKDASMSKKVSLKLMLIPNAHLDGSYYLFTNFINEVTHTGSLWGIFTISLNY